MMSPQNEWELRKGVMKTINISNILFVIALSVVMLCCGKDEENTPSSLVGSWKAISTKAIECPDPQENNIDECAPNNNCETWKFNSDGTFSRTTVGGDVVDGTFSAAAGHVSLCYTACGNYTYSISGSTLTITEFTDIDECLTEYELARI